MDYVIPMVLIGGVRFAFLIIDVGCASHEISIPHLSLA